MNYRKSIVYCVFIKADLEYLVLKLAFYSGCGLVKETIKNSLAYHLFPCFPLARKHSHPLSPKASAHIFLKCPRKLIPQTLYIILDLAPLNSIPYSLNSSTCPG